MRLYLIRHAEAVPRGTPGDAQDGDRPLTAEGLGQAREIGRALKQLGAPLACLMTSPYRRARQTAEQVARGFGDVPVKTWPGLQPDVPPSKTSKTLPAAAQAAATGWIGHEPHLSGWIAELVAGAGGMDCVMKKGGVACVEIERVPPPPGSGTLRWLLTPKHLRLVARSKASLRGAA